MRGPVLAATSVAVAAAIVLSWRQGSAAHNDVVAGIRVVTPARTPATVTTRPKKVKTKKQAVGQRPARTKKTVTATPAPVRRDLLGALVSTPYGDVQVRAVLVGRRLVELQAVHLTDANGRSRSISAGAAPILRAEALSAQSAKIDTVSGATYTSAGYRQSLQAILDQAHL